MPSIWYVWPELSTSWIGIDVTHYAVTLIEKRLQKIGLTMDKYTVMGRPTTIGDAHELAHRNKHQFQWWAAWLLGAQTYREAKIGPDGGIDGNIFFNNGPYGTGRIITAPLARPIRPEWRSMFSDYGE